MRTFARNVLRGLTANELCWSLARSLGLTKSRRLAYARGTTVRQRIVKSLGTPCRVSCGPFSGMIFPDLYDRGGGWLPRVLGTYEQEIAESIERAILANPAIVIDVGCAEGYYAVGLAMRIPDAQIDAYDIDEKERRICERMAKANGVDSRVFIKDRCSEQTLLSTDPSIRCLVLCDCEGAERELITSEVARHHKNSWFLIECHDFIHAGISSSMMSILSPTHDCVLVRSASDTEKAGAHAVHPLADRECLEVRKFIYGEGRPCEMNWIVASPRS